MVGWLLFLPGCITWSMHWCLGQYIRWYDVTSCHTTCGLVKYPYSKTIHMISTEWSLTCSCYSITVYTFGKCVRDTTDCTIQYTDLCDYISQEPTMAISSLCWSYQAVLLPASWRQPENIPASQIIWEYSASWFMK